MLVSTILPQKGKGSFEAFCTVLIKEEQQRHIVSEILKVETVDLLPVHSAGSESDSYADNEQ